jgi:hypothetical protein
MGMAVCAVLIVSGCSGLPTNRSIAVSNYVRLANAWAERCAHASPAGSAHAVAYDGECEATAEADIAPLRIEAEHSVRFQRGTRMYLEMYEAEWKRAMRRAVLSDGSASCVEGAEQADRLRSLSRSLEVP